MDCTFLHTGTDMSNWTLGHCIMWLPLLILALAVGYFETTGQPQPSWLVVPVGLPICGICFIGGLFIRSSRKNEP